jgi:hypothetical protein
MLRLVSDRLWSEIADINRNDKKQAAIAYVSTDLALSFHRDDVLVVDASDHAIKTGETSARLLVRFAKRGVTLFSLPGLHAKCVVLGDTVVVGSANMSAHSRDVLVEAALVTDSSVAVSAAIGWIEGLARVAAPIDDSFLKRISRIPVVRRTGPGGNKKAPRVHSPMPATWLLGVTEFEDVPKTFRTSYESERGAASKARRHRTSDIGWVTTYSATFKRLAKPGDLVIAMAWSGNRCSVAPPAAILRCTRKRSATMAHTEEFPGKKRTLTRTQFVEVLRRVDGPAIGKFPTRQLLTTTAVALDAVWPRS